MDSFAKRLAVVTGGGSGMGRELVVQLAAEGASVAMCDVSASSMEDTMTRCVETVGGEQVRDRLTSHICDVSDEHQMMRFRDEVMAQHETDHIHLLFNNAGIGGGGSFLTDDRSAWERTFDICWGGVYLGCRAFVPLVVAAEEGHIVNTASVNGFWASIGVNRPHTAYAAAKFAVKGFTEALITDLRIHAPHVRCSVVMPGHIGTEIVGNSMMLQTGGSGPEITERSNAFRNNAPTTAAEAATIILDGVRAGEWRILVGDDAHVLDALVRDDPRGAYESAFVRRMHEQGALEFLVAE